MGTKAHSHVEVLGSEQEDAEAFAAAHPGSAVVLVDTYGTFAGLDGAVATALQG